jgi:Ca-activated chloride channel family protein
MLLLGSAAFAAALAAAEPSRFVDDTEEEAGVIRRNAILAIDVSASMQANDVIPSRLSRATQVARELLAPPANANVGVLLFAGQGYTFAHPSEDLRAVDFLIQGVGPTVVSPQDPGSMLSTAILEAARLLELGARNGGERAIILISDGESGEAEAEVVAAVREATSQGVVVHAIGVGTLTGGEIPIGGGSGETSGFVLDAAGTPVVSRLQTPLLQRIAGEGGGEYAHSEDEEALESLRRVFQVSGGGSAETPASVAGPDLILLFTAVSLLLVFVDSVLEALDRGRSLISGSRRLGVK